MIRRNIEVEAHFIDDLLDVTRITRGKLELLRAPMDVHEAVRRAIEISTPDLDEKGQKLTVSLQATKTELVGDSTRVQQVFWNLLKNASKFTPDGGAIAISTRDEPGRVVITVTDTGFGIEADALERIFEAFAQASKDVTRKFGGLGLGLAISKAVVDAHRGSLRAESGGPGQGATFTVEIPLHQPAAEIDAS
jgi:two-component system CheB/CheR fusion protein